MASGEPRGRPHRRVRARLRVVGLLLVASLAACAHGTTPTGPATSGGAGPTDDPSAPEYRLAPHCPRPEGAFAVTADQVNKVVSNGSLPAWQAGDIGASTRLSDDRLVWVFGDTVRDDSHTPRIVANSLLITSGLCLSQVIAPNDGPVIPDLGPREVYWPMSVVRIDPRKVRSPSLQGGYTDLLVVLSGRIRRGGQNAFDFTYLGSSATVFAVRPGQAPQILGTQQISPDSTSPDQINWGAASMIDDDWYYVYGSRHSGDKNEFGRSLYVARVPISRPSERSGWEFYDGSRWQKDLARSAPVLPASQGVAQTLSVSKIDGQYVIVSKKGGDLGDFVYTWSSRSPVGPWVGKAGVKAPFEVSKTDVQYAPLGHPEVPLKSGNLLVSVSRNTTDLTALLTKPSEVGRPVFAEVGVPRL